jgi:hypothetical protein
LTKIIIAVDKNHFLTERTAVNLNYQGKNKRHAEKSARLN